MNINQLRQIIREELDNIANEAFNKKPLGRRFIPEDITLSKVTRDNFKEHFKLLKLSDGDYKLYITPLMLVALESITRGRSSYETNKRLSELAKLVSERIPTQIRGLLKKYAGKINSSIGLVPINTKIKEVTPEGDIVFFNPGNEKMADKAIDPTISENNQDFDEFAYMQKLAGLINENQEFDYQEDKIIMNNSTKDAILDDPELQDFITPKSFVMNNKGEIVLWVDWMDYDQFDKLAKFLGIKY